LSMQLRSIIGQPGSSSIISRVKLGQTTVQLGKRAGFDDVGHRLGLTTGEQRSVCKTPCLSTGTAMPLTGTKTVQERPLLSWKGETRLLDCVVVHPNTMKIIYEQLWLRVETDMSLRQQLTHDVHVVNLFADFDTFLVRLQISKLQYLNAQYKTHFKTTIYDFTISHRFLINE